MRATTHYNSPAQPPTDDERREAASFARHSLGTTHNLMSDTISVPCGSHGARTGQYCFGSDRSGVRGVCPHRIANGQRAAALEVKVWPQPPMLLHQLVARPLPARRSTPPRGAL
jgi:hypothetical protein